MKAMVEFPPKWDFSNWTYLTKMACSPGKINAIHEYEIELQRPAREIVAATQDHRDTADINDERVEAADREGAPAQESNALPPGGTSLFAHGSSDKSEVMSKKQPQPTQTTDREDQQLVLMESERKVEEQEQEVEQLEQVEELVASPPPAPPLSSARADAMEQDEQRQEFDKVDQLHQGKEMVTSPPPEPPLSSPHAEAVEQEEHRQDLSMVANEQQQQQQQKHLQPTPPPTPWPPPPLSQLKLEAVQPQEGGGDDRQERD